MLIAVFAAAGRHLNNKTMNAIHLHPRSALKSGAKHLASGVAPFRRKEVVVWALLQSLVVWMAVVTAMLLAGCASFGNNKTVAKAIDAQTLAVSQTLGPNGKPDAPWPADDWWKQFNDPALNALVDEGLTTGNSISLRSAEARLKAAQAIVRGAQSTLYPSVALNASSTREHFSENGIFPPHFAGVDNGAFGGGTFTQNSATVDLAWDIDFWGRNRAAIESAKSQVRMAEADQQAARLALSTSIARSWFQLQRLGALREVTDQAIRQRTDVAALAQQRFDAGLDTNAELRQAEALLPEARVELAQIDESIGLVKNQIAALLGQGPDRGRSIGTPHGVASAVVAVPASLPAELVGRRPDIVAARWRVEAAQGQIDEARAEFYPNVNLAASIGLVALGTTNFLKGSSRQWSGGPALTLPIFEGGRLRANLAGRDADYDAAVEQYNQTVVDAVKDVADQVVSLQSVNAQLADQELARVKTEQAYDVAVVRYKAGLTTYLTVLNAQTSVLQQERADAELKARILDLNVALMRALGGGFHGNASGESAPLAAR